MEVGKGKKQYDKPMLMMEEFVPNQYVAACDLTGVILNAIPICAIPGSGVYYIKDGTKGNTSPYHDQAAGVSKTHGSCGMDTGSIVVSGSTGTEPNGQGIVGLQIGDEMSAGDEVTNSIGSLRSWSSLGVNRYYKAKWISYDTSGTRYDHYGALYVQGYENRSFS